jgi:ADP-heptose:LPS heptosyltransferase
MKMQKILIVQTAFIGDAILATAVVEKMHAYYPKAKIDFLVRKGNEAICANHPFLNKVVVFDKSSKYKNLYKLITALRKEHYDLTVNLQRFLTTGLITILSGAKETAGFSKNPLSFLFSHTVNHDYSSDTKVIHEVDRNQKLIQKYTDAISVKPKLYPAEPTIELSAPYVCLAPYSIWFTKQYPLQHWISLVKLLAPQYTVYLMGAPSDKAGCDGIIKEAGVNNVVNLAGTLSLLDSAGVMQGASMNFVNDSAPLHLASAVNAPVCAFFCSTVPAFGFTPLSDKSWVFETSNVLSCKPCGLHGKKGCPEGHFKCGEISPEKVIQQLGLLR